MITSSTVISKNENDLLEVSWTERTWYGKTIHHEYEFLWQFWVKKNTGHFADVKTQHTIFDVLKTV